MQAKHSQTKQLYLILLVIFIGFVGIAMPYPLFPPLFLHPVHGGIIPDNWHQSARGIFLGVTLAAYPFGQFLGSPILGSLSDQYGRKIILTLSLLGTVFGYGLSALALYKNNLLLLILSRILTGLMEGNIAIARAMAADLKNINKQKAFGYINTVASIAYLVGPLFGGVLSDKGLSPYFNYALPFILAAVISLVTMGLVYYFIQDFSEKTLSQEKLISQFNIIKKLKLLCENNDIRNLLILSTLFTFAVDTFYEYGPVLLTGRWNMTSAQLAIYNVILCVGLSIGSGLVIHRLEKKIKKQKLLPWTMAISAILFLLLILSPWPIGAYVLFGLLGLFITINTTNLGVQLSDSADSAIQGEVMGTQMSLRTLGDAIICLVGGGLILLWLPLPILISMLIAGLTGVLYAMFYSKA